jgi:pyridoxal biosynthesis lyase PdxS
MIRVKVEGKGNINSLSKHMKEIIEKILNDKAARDADKLMDIAAGENEFSTWD